jgi:thiol-disulfide isomerase/thioredoxin
MIFIKNILQASFFLAVGFLACNNSSDNSVAQAPENQAPMKDTGTAVVSTDSHSAKQLPSFLMINQAGGQTDLTSFQGKKVFVNLWASWCPPCRREMPSIQKLYHSVDTSKVAFIMLGLDDDFEKSKNYMTSQKLNIPLYYPAQNMPEMFNVPSIPTTFIFNEQGQLIDKIVGGDDYDSDKYRKMLK